MLDVDYVVGAYVGVLAETVLRMTVGCGLRTRGGPDVEDCDAKHVVIPVVKYIRKGIEAGEAEQSDGNITGDAWVLCFDK